MVVLKVETGFRYGEWQPFLSRLPRLEALTCFRMYWRGVETIFRFLFLEERH